MTCLNTRSHTVIDRLEQTLGKPVITSTQATLWHALRLAGIEDHIRGYGSCSNATDRHRARRQPSSAKLHLFAGTAPLRGAHIMIMSATEWRGPA